MLKPRKNHGITYVIEDLRKNPKRKLRGIIDGPDGEPQYFYELLKEDLEIKVTKNE